MLLACLFAHFLNVDGAGVCVCVLLDQAMNPLSAKLGDLEGQFASFTQEQEAHVGMVVSQLIEAYLAQVRKRKPTLPPNCRGYVCG